MEVDVDKLKALREERVLSQRKLARMANLAQGTLWRIENGFSEVHPQTIRKLAGVLGVEPKELVKRGVGKWRRRGAMARDLSTGAMTAAG
jgi:transcriptional regulator with XRE-family HTH domain